MTDFLAIFDVDGTLIDSKAVILDTMTRAFDDAGQPPPAEQTVITLVGLSLPRMIETLAPHLDEAVQSKILAAYRVHFAQAMKDGGEPMLYPGVDEGLDQLRARGISLGLATGKSKRGLDRLIAAMGWQGHFATLQCADFHPSKPHPSMVRRALLETATEDRRAVMVGDTVFDVEMARAANVAAIGVDWGYHKAEVLRRAGANPVLSDFPTLVTEIERRAG